MKKCTVRSIVAFITTLCLLTASLTAGAVSEEQSVQPRYTGITSLVPNLTISSKGRANCTTTVKLGNGYTANVTMKLEYSTNRLTWYEKTSWSASGSGTINMDETYTVSSGYYYRVSTTVNVYAANGNLVDNPTSSTSNIKY